MTGKKEIAEPAEATDRSGIARRIKRQIGTVTPELERPKDVDTWFVYIGGGIVGLTVVLAVFGPLLAPYGPNESHAANVLAGPSLEHTFGTDANGRDIFTRVMHGFRRLFLIAGLGLVGSFAIGSATGIVAGYYGGAVDELLMRTADGLMAFPALILGLAIVAAFGPSQAVLVFVLMVGFAPNFARMGRNVTLSLREELWVKALQVKGVGDGRILRKHVFPNSLSSLLEQAMLQFGIMVIIIASLSFLGVGIQPPNASLGVMVSEGAHRLEIAWWFSTFPAIAIGIIVLGPTLLAQGIKDRNIRVAEHNE